MLMRGWSIPAGQWFGISVRLHLSFLFLLVFVWLVDSGTGDPILTLGPALAFTGMALASVGLREAGRLFALGGKEGWPRAIVLLPTGGLWIAEVTPVPKAGPRTAGQLARQARTALAGPMASLLVAGIAALCLHFWRPPVPVLQLPLLNLHHLARSAVWINVFLAALNLLPAYPLDGGRILRAHLGQSMDGIAASRRAAAIAIPVIVALMFAGLWNSWLMLAGFFVFLAAQLDERTIAFQSVLESVQMEEIMLTEFSTLSPADTLEDALGKAVHTLQDDFPVVRGADMVGVVSRQKIVQALRSGENAYVQSVMERGYETAGRHDSLALAFRKITHQGLTIIPIVEQERLVGIVTLQNLMHSMSVLAESRKLRRQAEEEEDDDLF